MGSPRLGHTRDFDEAVVWLATQCSKTAVVELMWLTWRTVGSIVPRVSGRPINDRR